MRLLLLQRRQRARRSCLSRLSQDRIHSHLFSHRVIPRAAAKHCALPARSVPRCRSYICPTPTRPERFGNFLKRRLAHSLPPRDSRDHGNCVTVTVGGMHCASCVGRVENAILALNGVDSAVTSLVSGKLRACSRTIDRRALGDMCAAKIQELGYVAFASSDTRTVELSWTVCTVRRALAGSRTHFCLSLEL